MKKGFKITVDDQFHPTAVELSSDKKKLRFILGDNKSCDNSGGCGRITLFDKETDEQITIYLPKSAVAAVREVFRNAQ